ncbi:SafA/ExsA family spore coat assembly protein, partial [Mesorhizobium sp. M00.F.Ca.ET.186.01.1.1]
MRIHIVQKGDSMWKIAKRYGVDYKELLRLNSQIKTPDTLYPGARIKIPTKSVPVRPQPRTTPHPMSEAAPYVKERPRTEAESEEVPRQIERRPIEPEEEVQIESETRITQEAPSTPPAKERPPASPGPLVSPETIQPTPTPAPTPVPTLQPQRVLPPAPSAPNIMSEPTSPPA